MIKLAITYQQLIQKLAPERSVGEQVKVTMPVYVKTPSGFTKILAVIEKPSEDIQRTVLDDGSFVDSSTNHLFLSDGVITKAKDVVIIDRKDGVYNVVSKEIVAHETTFDISIESPHLYYSDHRKIIHHNSYFAISAVKNFLTQFPMGIAFYFESESAITKDMLISRGIDVKRVGIVPVVTVQDFKKQSIKILDNYEKQDVKERQPIFFVLDSMGMLSTIKEIEDSSSGTDTRDMTRAQQLKAVFRVLTLRLGRAQIPLFVTNHTYDSMSLYGGAIQGGGQGAVYASSIILTLTKAKEKDSSNTVIGSIVSVTATKSRLIRENTKIKCLIRFDGGLDRYYYMVELAEAAGVFKKVSTRYEMKDGTKVFGKTINENPDKYFTPEVLNEINTWVQNNFSYGSTTEITLGEDDE